MYRIRVEEAALRDVAGASYAKGGAWKRLGRRSGPSASAVTVSE